MRKFIIMLFIIHASFSFCFAQPEGKKGEKKQEGPPPALVTVSEITSGMVEPMTEYVGTVFYSHVSELASEVEGRAERVSYEEGQRIKKGAVMVRLNTDLINTSIKGKKAEYEQALVELEKAKKDLNRLKPLFEQESISEAAYDDAYYEVLVNEQRAVMLKASLEQLELEKAKKTIRAPFAGVVIEKALEKGEWVSEGGTIAILADYEEVDVIVDVPEEVLGYLKEGRKIEVMSGGKRLKGTFLSFIPKGDVATRTFSVKVRLENTASLIEGMEARAMLPSGEGFKGLLVSRDAIIDKFGQNVIFLVDDGKAKMVPVEIKGFSGMMAGITGRGLSEGRKAVIKGHERIMDGQPLKIMGGK